MMSLLVDLSMCAVLSLASCFDLISSRFRAIYPIYLSLYLSLSLSLYLSIYLSINLSFHISIYSLNQVEALEGFLLVLATVS